MTIFEHLGSLELIVHAAAHHAERSAVASGMALWGGAPASSGGGRAQFIAWDPSASGAMQRDTDGDGIPDALDFYFGPGAFPPGFLPTGHH